MDRRQAARLLGVTEDASPDEARAAFRTLIRERHPDRAGATATTESALLIEAHRTLRVTVAGAAEATAAPPPRPSRPTASTPLDARVEGDSLLIDDDPATVMARLVEAGHQLGEITYLDRSSGYVEVLLQVCEEGDVAPAAVSMVASLQGRAEGIEVFCTVERLDGHPAPPVAPLVEALAEVMAGRG